MSLEAWFTLAVLVATLGVLVSERIAASFAVLGAVTVLLTARIIDPAQALSGFSNPAPISVAALYVLAAGAETTGALERFTEAALGRGRGGLLRVLAPTAVASAFLNNTPIIAMVAPRVAAWARRTGRPPSRYLMALSFAAILGGLGTLIGTSTTVVVSGLLADAGREPLGFFEISPVGVPIGLVGLVALVGVSRLLPHRRAPSDDLADPREFTVEMLVTADSPLAGRSVAEANLRNLEGVYLVEIERDGRFIAPVGPSEPLRVGDRLTFAGNVRRVLDLQKMSGLTSAEERHFDVSDEGAGPRFYEVVVAPGSELAGSTLKEVGFRGRYGAAVVAVHRAGERLPGKLGQVVLRPGDVLLVLADAAFPSRWSDHRSFAVLAPLAGATPLRHGKAWVVGLVAAALVGTVASGLLGLLEGSLLAAAALVLSGVLSAREARDAVDIGVVVLIAASFGLGAAITESGLAAVVADVITDGFGRFGNLGLLAGVILATLVLTELVTNNAAAVLVFPIALATAGQAGLDPRPFAIAVAVAASASFLTPIGYQTNTMVYGMGGYRFGDFARAGAPLTLLVAALALLLIPLVWPLGAS